MKRLAVNLVVTLTLFGVSFAAQKASSFSGEIMDSQCAEMGSHEALMKRQGGPRDAKACTRGCITMSAQFVLYDANSNTVYRLDDQKKPKQFAGKKVMVTGTLDDGRKTIHVANIRAAS